MYYIQELIHNFHCQNYNTQTRKYNHKYHLLFFRYLMYFLRNLNRSRNLRYQDFMSIYCILNRKPHPLTKARNQNFKYHRSPQDPIRKMRPYTTHHSPHHQPIRLIILMLINQILNR